MPRQLWSGFYINLDGSTDRRRAIEADLAEAGVRDWYHRLPAVAPGPAARSALTAGEIGCFKSRHAILGMAHAPGRLLHVLEDDALIPAEFPAVIAGLLDTPVFAKYDLVYTNVNIVDPNPVILRTMLAQLSDATRGTEVNYRIVDLKPAAFVGSDSYLVSPQSIAKVGALLQAEIDAGGPRVPLDHFYREQIFNGKLRAGCIFPFVTSVRQAGTASTIGSLRGDALGQSQLHDLLRYAFYVDCDWSIVKQALAQHRADEPRDPRFELIAAIQRAMLAG